MNKKSTQTIKNAYKTVQAIMSGSINTDELVDFLLENKISSLTEQTLQTYLAAICDSAVYRLDSSQFDKPILDIVGTGGDRKRTANISTLASLICAATGLVYVAKYGNRSASGVCGSMDVLESLGIEIELTKNEVENNLKKIGFAPLYASSIYPGGKYVAEARRKIGKPTLFNLLFPLARPVYSKQRFIFGCANEDQMKIVEKIFAKQKNVRCLIVHGLDGTDEIAISGTGQTRYILIDEGRVTRGIIDCFKIFNISPINLSLLQISTKEEAIQMFASALNPKIKDKKITAIRNAGLVNAAVGLFIALDNNNMDISDSRKYIEVASNALLSGKVFTLVNTLSLRNI